MGVLYRKLLDSSVALKKRQADWLQIRAGLFGQHLFFGVTLKHARQRDLIVAAQLRSVVAGTGAYPHQG